MKTRDKKKGWAIQETETNEAGLDRWSYKSVVAKLAKTTLNKNHTTKLTKREKHWRRENLSDQASLRKPWLDTQLVTALAFFIYYI